MADLADLYPGYASRWIDTSIGKIFARVGGSGPPLLLLHGHPQSNVMWHRVAPMLAPHFTLVIADLPGYGWSAVPEADADHAPYTKRAMAAVMVEVMDSARLRPLSPRRPRSRRAGRLSAGARPSRPARAARRARHHHHLGHVAPHRRAACLARLALDVSGAAGAVSRDADRPRSDVLLRLPRARAGAKAKHVSIFDPRALAHYHAAYEDPLRIHAMCEDYRAGRTTDLAHDEADRAAGKKIGCPVLALWGTGGLPANAGIDALASLARLGAGPARLCNRKRTLPAGGEPGRDRAGIAGILRRGARIRRHDHNRPPERLFRHPRGRRAAAVRCGAAGSTIWATHVAGFAGPIVVSQFKGGQSNPTYLVETPLRRYVLRRKPPGKLLPSAHAVDREYRIISALHAQTLPGCRAGGLLRRRKRRRHAVLRHGPCRGPRVLGAADAGVQSGRARGRSTTP